MPLARLKQWWLIHQLMSGSDKDVRTAAAEALGKIGDARAVEPLIKALKDSDSDVRSEVAEALGQLGDARAVEPLTKALKDSGRNVRSAAAEALGQLGDTRAVEPLIEALKNSDNYVRSVVAEALESLQWQPDETEAAVYYWIAKHEFDRCANLGQVAIKPLIPMLSVHDTSARRSAIAEALESLQWQPDETEAAAYYWIAKREFDRCVNLGPVAVKPLIQTLRERENITPTWQDKEAQTQVVDLLVQIGSPAVAPLIEALKNSDNDVQSAHVKEAAAKALGKIGSMHAVDVLIEKLDQKESDIVIRAAAWALGEIGDARAAAPLNKRTRDWSSRSEMDRAFDKIRAVNVIDQREVFKRTNRAILEITTGFGTTGYKCSKCKSTLERWGEYCPNCRAYFIEDHTIYYDPHQ